MDNNGDPPLIWDSRLPGDPCLTEGAVRGYWFQPRLAVETRRHLKEGCGRSSIRRGKEEKLDPDVDV